MREIIISALLFAVLIAGIAVNSVFIRDFYEYAIETAQKMPSAESEGCYEAVCAFDEYWHKKKTAVSFSVSYDDVERITEIKNGNTEISDVETVPDFFQSLNIEEDSTFWINRQIARYYDVEKITLKTQQ